MICRQVSRKQIWSSHRKGLCRWLYSSTTVQPSPVITGCASTHPLNHLSRRFTWKDVILSRSRISSLLNHNNLNNFKGSLSVQRYYLSTNALADIPVAGIIDVPLAQTGEGIAECELLQWFVQEGDQVEEFQPLCEVQSDKATIEITSRYKGKVSHILHLPGNIVKVGETLLKLTMDDYVVPEETLDSVGGLKLLDSDGLDIDCQNSVPKPCNNRPGVLATPAVRNLAKQHGIDINDVCGSGNEGRVLKEDVLSYAANKGTARGTSSPINGASTVGDYVTSGEEYTDTTIPLRGYQRAMVKSMTLAAKIPHFHYVEEINCNALVELKSSFQSANSDAQVKYTFLPILIKSLSMALTKYPWLNSCFHEENTEVVLKGPHNIGVAMATPNGLVVPNLKKVQSLSILEITKELSRLQQLALANKLSPEDLAGGTITLSNIGTIGGKFGSPLVNSPEVCIIAIGRIQKVPRFDEDGNVYPQSVMTVNIGADHRVLDGATVARFCNEWKLYIENPELLMLHMR